MFNEKTGNPSHDNTARKLNRSIRKGTRARFTIQARGWKRRKVLYRLEGDRINELIVAIVTQKIKQADEAERTP